MGALKGVDLLRADAKKVFQDLNKVIEKSIITIDKLKKATIRLHNVKGTAKEARALTKVNKENAKRIADLRTIDTLNKKLTASQTMLNISTKKTAVSTGILGKAFTSLKGSMLGVIGPFATIIGLFTLIGKLKETLINLDSFRFALDKITGSSAKTEESMRFLIGISQDFGIALSTTTNRYVKFFTAAKQSGLAVKETRQIFSDMSKAAGVLGLKAHELEGVFLALEQMLSKGKVTTEELRRQLGERLPGAFGIMARTIQILNPNLIVTVQTLDDMLKKGQILSHEVLPLFTQTYNEAFGIDKVKKIETLIAAQTRFQNSWSVMIFELENGSNLMSKAFIAAFDVMTNHIKRATDFMIILGAESATTFEIMREWAGGTFGKVLPFDFLQDMLNLSDARRKEIILAERERIVKDKLVDTYVRLTADVRVHADLKEIEAEAILMSKEALDKAIDTMIDAADAQSSLTREVVRSLNWYDKWIKIEKDKAKAIDITTEAGVKQRDGILDDIESVEKWLEQFKRVKKELDEIKDVDVFAPEPESIAGLDLIIRKNKEIIKITTDPAIKAQLQFENEAHQLELDYLNKKIELEEYLNELYQEREEMDEPFDFDTKDLAFLGIGAGKLPGQGGFQTMMPMLLAKFKAQGGGDADEMEEFFKNEEQLYLDQVKLVRDTEKQIADEKKEKNALIFDTAKQLGNQIFELRNALAERELENINAEIRATKELYDIKISLARNEDEKRKTLEKQKFRELKKLNAERLKIERKQAKIAKEQAIFNILLNIATGITAALTIPIGGFVLAALVGALGAVELATVIAYPLPKYALGRGDGKEEWAITGDGGRSEIISGRRGVRKTPSVPTITHLDKTDEIYPSERAYKDMVMNSIQHEINTNFESKQIEDAIEKGFRKARINNYVKIPKIDIKLDHLFWLQKHSQFN